MLFLTLEGPSSVQKKNHVIQGVHTNASLDNHVMHHISMEKIKAQQIICHIELVTLRSFKGQ